MLAVLATLLAFGNLVLGFAAVGFTPPPGMFSDMNASLPIDGINASLLRWSLICDLFGDYLLLGPLALVLSRRFGKTRPNLMRLATCCALVYVLVGAIGAAVLMATTSPLIEAYAQASGAERVAIKVTYDTSLTSSTVSGTRWGSLWAVCGG